MQKAKHLVWLQPAKLLLRAHFMFRSFAEHVDFPTGSIFKKIKNRVNLFN